MNNSVVGFMIRQNSYRGFPSRSCRLLFPFCMAGCSYKILRSLSSCSPASSDAHQENKVSRIHTDWHRVAANKQAAHSATMWLCRLRLHPSNAQQACLFFLHKSLKYNTILSLISHVYSDEGCAQTESGNAICRTADAVLNNFYNCAVSKSRQSNRPHSCKTG